MQFFLSWLAAYCWSEKFKKPWSLIEIFFFTHNGRTLFMLMSFQYHANWTEKCCECIDNAELEWFMAARGMLERLRDWVSFMLDRRVYLNETRSHARTRYSMPWEDFIAASHLRFVGTWYLHVNLSYPSYLFSLYVFPALPFAAEARTPVLNHISLGKLLPLTLSESTLCFNWCDCM